MKYKKLTVDLPRQPLVNQRPWSIAGWVLAIVFLLAAVYTYFHEAKKSSRLNTVSEAKK